MSESRSYYMEEDGAVKIPERYKKMSHEDISAECTHLIKEIKGKGETITRKIKTPTKAKFII